MWESLGPAGSRKNPQGDLGKPQNSGRMVRGKEVVAGQCYFQAAAKGRAMDCRNHRFGIFKEPGQHLAVGPVDLRYELRVISLKKEFYVGAGDKGIGFCRMEDEPLYLRVIHQGNDLILHCNEQIRGHGVDRAFRVVKGHQSNTPMDLGYGNFIHDVP